MSLAGPTRARSPRACSGLMYAGVPIAAPVRVPASSSNLGPGYDARLATRHEVVRERNDGRTYDRMWKTALRAGADIVTITSYNEWQEGTQIEPARIAVGKPNYEGAWEKTGVAAQRAYLAATTEWTARLGAAPRR